MSSLVRYRNEIAYGILAAMVILAFVFYERHVNREFTKADRLSCANRRVLLANQRIVLGFLLHNTQHLEQVGDPDAAYFHRTHLQVHKALVALENTPSCQEARDGK